MGRGQLHNGELRERPLRPFHRRRVRKGNPMIKDSSMSPSKPPTRRTTRTDVATVPGVSSKPPTRRTTTRCRALESLDSSKPPTRRTTRSTAFCTAGESSKPPTRRTTMEASRDSISVSSKPPTRRTTSAIRDNIFIFQRITYWHPPIASSASTLFNYFIPKGFSEQLFYEAKRKLQKR